MMPIDNSSLVKYKGTTLESFYNEGREGRMEGLNIQDNPYRLEDRDEKSHIAAWKDGWSDENIWALDSTGR